MGRESGPLDPGITWVEHPGGARARREALWSSRRLLCRGQRRTILSLWSSRTGRAGERSPNYPGGEW